MRLQRVIGPLLLAVLLAGVAIAFVVSAGRQQSVHSQVAVVTVRGLIGSEKQSFLTDPRVLAELRKNGVDLQVDTSGSRAMALRQDLGNYDFGFPAGVPGAQKLMQTKHVTKSYSPFFTPMTVASWKPIADILIANGYVKKIGSDYYIVDMGRLIQAMAAHKRWDQLEHHDAYDVGKSILISSTDVRQSNSAAMYLSLASYLLNNDEIVQDQSQVLKVMPAASELFLRQGYQESSSAGPFDDYTTIGMGKAPLVMCYEAQFIEYEIDHQNDLNPNMVLLYPKPTVYTKHELIPFDDKGDKVGELLENDPVLIELAGEHGLRTADPAYKTFWKQHHVVAPDVLVDVVDPPSYDILEALIHQVELRFNNSSN